MDDKQETTVNMHTERTGNQPHYIDSFTVRRRQFAPEEISEYEKRTVQRKLARNRMMRKIASPLISAFLGASIMIGAAEIADPGISTKLITGADPTGIFEPSDNPPTAINTTEGK